MHYICIENNNVVSLLDYEPNVPSSVTVVTITDEQNSLIHSGTHYFDVPSKSVLPVASEITARKTQDLANGLEREFLNTTDWKILRHLRQKALNTPTSMTESEYLALEQQRAAAAARIS
jgi:hypothetical protein